MGRCIKVVLLCSMDFILSWDFLTFFAATGVLQNNIIVLIATRPITSPIKQYEDLTHMASSYQKLGKLAHEDCVEIIKSIYNSDEVPKKVVDLLVQKSEGNPFYIRELSQVLLENGLVGVEEEKEKENTKRRVLMKQDSFSAISIPDTLQKTILSRLVCNLHYTTNN